MLVIKFKVEIFIFLAKEIIVKDVVDVNTNRKYKERLNMTLYQEIMIFRSFASGTILQRVS